MSGTNSPLVWNERLKLQANALDRASTASLVLGVLGPVAAKPGSTGPSLQPAVWFTGALALHLVSYWLLGRLRS